MWSMILRSFIRTVFSCISSKTPFSSRTRCKFCSLYDRTSVSVGYLLTVLKQSIINGAYSLWNSSARCLNPVQYLLSMISNNSSSEGSLTGIWNVSWNVSGNSNATAHETTPSVLSARSQPLIYSGGMPYNSKNWFTWTTTSFSIPAGLRRRRRCFLGFSVAGSGSTMPLERV